MRAGGSTREPKTQLPALPALDQVEFGRQPGHISLTRVCAFDLRDSGHITTNPGLHLQLAWRVARLSSRETVRILHAKLNFPENDRDKSLFLGSGEVLR